MMSRPGNAVSSGGDRKEAGIGLPLEIPVFERQILGQILGQVLEQVLEQD